MPYDEGLARRIRPLFARRMGAEEKKMFGGVGFLVCGNMCVGVWKAFLIVRCGKEQYDEMLTRPHVREFDITGRAMSGWVMVEPEGYEREANLNTWVNLAVDFVNTLPAK